MLFHGTLQRWAQLLDELPMIYSASVYIYIIWCNDDNLPQWKRTMWSGILSSISILITTSMILFPEHSNLFFVPFGILTTILFLSLLFLYKNIEKVNRMWVETLFMFIFGFFLWVIENTFCPSIEFMKFHSFWHFFSGLAGYRMTCLTHYIYLKSKDSQKYILEDSGILNYIFPYTREIKRNE